MVKHSTHSRNRSNQSFDVIKDDIATIKRDLAALFGERMGDMSDRTKELLRDGAERAKAVHEQVGTFAGNRPMTTIVMSALAGAVGVKVLGWMFRH